MPIVDAVTLNPTRLTSRLFGTSYLWSPGTGLSDSLSYAPMATITAEQQYNVSVKVKSGCITTDTVLVRVFKGYSIFVPNMFTPNGDGINDKVSVNMIGIKELKFFRIFNRAGKKVFETTSAGNGWDGTVNGVLQPLDSYMWVAEGESIQGGLIRERGMVTLIR
jgi:gliding motility-associated-like protein